MILTYDIVIGSDREQVDESLERWRYALEKKRM